MNRTRIGWLGICAAALPLVAQNSANAGLVTAGRAQFERRCAGCHGADGTGGERAPSLAQADREKYLRTESIRNLIRTGIPDAGMPAFDVPEAELAALAAFVRSRIAPASESPVSGDADAGRSFFFGRAGCSACHRFNGQGGSNGPDLTAIGRERTLAEIEQALRDPGRRRDPGYRVATILLRSGDVLRGFLRNESNYDLEVQGFDRRLHLLERSDVVIVHIDNGSFMPPFTGSAEDERNLIAFLIRGRRTATTAAKEPTNDDWSEIAHPRAGDWPTYHGNLGGNRYTTLSQITPANVGRLAPRWMFTLPGSRSQEVTPVVIDGVMYITTVNEAFALDASSGREIWHYERPRGHGLVGDAAGGINRGVAVLGDRVFMVTDNCHLIALDRLTGTLLWDTEMADSRQHYGATSAPLVVRDLVISGTSGGDEGIRGFVAAYKASTGERVWRFWTVPAPGEPLAAGWKGRAIEHGCTSAWLTGTYDAETNLLFWTTGNPCPDFNGDERKGDNLYSDSVLALDPATGELKWHYQFTPHDLHDWDAAETPMVVDAMYGGRDRRLLLQGNRNGFFYVLDRTNGQFLAASPFVDRLTWASGVDSRGRPMLVPGSEPTAGGTRACPSMDGATNWMSTAFSPATGLFYLTAFEKCSIFAKSSAWWRQGESFYGGAARDVPGETKEQWLRAIDIQTGTIRWQYREKGGDESWGGVLASATGLVFFAEQGGAFTALDAASGAPLWHFPANVYWKASPMTYLAHGKQYIAIAAGSNIIAFGL